VPVLSITTLAVWACQTPTKGANPGTLALGAEAEETTPGEGGAGSAGCPDGGTGSAVCPDGGPGFAVGVWDVVGLGRSSWGR
jgi:hypothetical protein